MALNPFFDLQGAPNEQDLVENLIIEAIQMYGMMIHYIPKTLVDYNSLLSEDPRKSFLREYPIEAYFENVEGFMGDKNFLNKMGWNISKQATFVLSKKVFQEVLSEAGGTDPGEDYTRPHEGDLIYIPLTHDLFEITFADHETTFYQLGKIYVWKLTCEKYNYSHEIIDTGNSEIDSIATDLENNDSVVNDPLADNDEVRDQINTFLDPGLSSPF